MKGRTIVWGLALVAVGVVIGPRVMDMLPASVGDILARLGGTPSVETAFLGRVEKQNELTVLRAEIVSVVKSRQPGMIGPLDTTTYVIVPGAVRYVVYPSRIMRRDLDWDRGSQTLKVTVDDPVPVEPAIDATRMVVPVEGIDLQSGDERQAIAQASLKVARDDIIRRARRDPAILASARTAGREALQTIYEGALASTGARPVVIIRFRSENDIPRLTKG